MKAFTHERWIATFGRDSAASHRPSRPEVAIPLKNTGGDDGVIRAVYGPVEIIANLGPQPRIVAGHALPAFGFRATAPGVIATSLQDDGTSFVAEGDTDRADVWVYAAPESNVEVVLPARIAGKLTLTLNAAPVTVAQESGRTVRLQLPPRGGARDVKLLWHATVRPSQ